jgi:hypothetical protein
MGLDGAGWDGMAVAREEGAEWVWASGQRCNWRQCVGASVRQDSTEYLYLYLYFYGGLVQYCRSSGNAWRGGRAACALAKRRQGKAKARQGRGGNGSPGQAQDDDLPEREV